MTDLLTRPERRHRELESGETQPNLSVALALQVIFSRSPRAIFKGLYRKIEGEVMAAAAKMALSLPREPTPHRFASKSF